MLGSCQYKYVDTAHNVGYLLIMKLRDYLHFNRLTAREFGALAGASEHTVGKWSRGERTPRPESMRAIATVTDGAVTANDFMNAHLKSDKEGAAS